MKRKAPPPQPASKRRKELTVEPTQTAKPTPSPSNTHPSTANSVSTLKPTVVIEMSVNQLLALYPIDHIDVIICWGGIVGNCNSVDLNILAVFQAGRAET